MEVASALLGGPRGAGAWGKVQLLIHLHQGEGQGLQS